MSLEDPLKWVSTRVISEVHSGGVLLPRELLRKEVGEVSVRQWVVWVRNAATIDRGRPLKDAIGIAAYVVCETPGAVESLATIVASVGVGSVGSIALYLRNIGALEARFYPELPPHAWAAFRRGGFEALQEMVADGRLDAGCYECPNCNGTGAVNRRSVTSARLGITLNMSDECINCLGSKSVIDIGPRKSQRCGR